MLRRSGAGRAAHRGSEAASPPAEPTGVARPPGVARSAGTTEVELVVNGEPWHGAVPPGEMLLRTLRERLGLTGSKPACERGECGACTVLIGDRPRVSCITPVVTVDAPVVTIEGLATASQALRETLAATGGFQCGYCTPGQVVAAMAILADGSVSEAEVRRRMAGNICRCTGYTPIVDAILAAGKS